MLRLALLLSLSLGAATALADNPRAEAIKAAKEKAKTRRAAMADKVEKRAEKIEERAERVEERIEERAQRREDHPGLGLGHGVGKALTVAAENEKHQSRLARFAGIELKVQDRPELLARIAQLRAKEGARHDKALARLAKIPDGRKSPKDGAQ